MNPAQPPEGILDPQKPYWSADKVGEATWLRLKGNLTGRRVEGLSENFTSYVKLGDADADKLIENLKKWGKYPQLNQTDKSGGAYNAEAYQKWLVEEFLEKPFREEVDKKIEEAAIQSRLKELDETRKEIKEAETKEEVAAIIEDKVEVLEAIKEDINPPRDEYQKPADPWEGSYTTGKSDPPKATGKKTKKKGAPKGSGKTTKKKKKSPPSGGSSPGGPPPPDPPSPKKPFMSKFGVGKSVSKVKSSLKGGKKSAGGLESSSIGSSTGGPIAAGTGVSILSFGSLIGKKINNAFENAKEEKERAQQAEAAGAEVPEEAKQKGYFVKKALGYEFGGRAFDTTFGAFVSSMPSKQSSGGARFSDQFDYGENDPKNKGKDKSVPQILAKGFKDVSKAFSKISDRLTTQNNLLKSVLDQSVINGELLEKIKESISALSALEMQSDEEDSQNTQDESADIQESDEEAQPDENGLDILGLLGGIDDALDIAKHLKGKGKKTKRRPGVKRRYARKRFGRMFGRRRVKLAAGGTTMGAVPAMLGEAGPELVTNRFAGPSAFGVGGMKGGQYLGLAQPLATAMEMPIKASGGIMLANMSGFLRSSGPMGGVLAPMFATFAMPMSSIFGMSRSMINSTIFGSVSSMQDSADYITDIFKNVFKVLNLKSLFSGGGDDGGDGGGSPPGPPGPGKVIQGGDADFWTLAAAASLEGITPQGEADVAQAVYNRVASGAYSVKTIKDALLSPGQFQPVTYDGADLNKWKAVKDRESAIAAVATHRGKGIATATKYVDEGAKSISNPSLQRSAAEFVGGRTDFAATSAYRPQPGAIGRVDRHGHVFGWFVGQGSIAYGRTNPGPAKVPNFPIKAESGTSAASGQTKPKFSIISGPESGYPVPGQLTPGAEVEGHGDELVETSPGGFKIFPLENRSYSLTRDPEALLERWTQIASRNNVPPTNRVLTGSNAGGGLHVYKPPTKMRSGGSVGQNSNVSGVLAFLQKKLFGPRNIDRKRQGRELRSFRDGQNAGLRKRNFGEDYKRQELILSARAEGRSGLADIRGNQIPRSIPKRNGVSMVSAKPKKSLPTPAEDKSLTPMQQWAKNFPDLAKKVKPGSSGYAEIQALLNPSSSGFSSFTPQNITQQYTVDSGTTLISVQNPPPAPPFPSSGGSSSYSDVDIRQAFFMARLMDYR